MTFWIFAADRDARRAQQINRARQILAKIKREREASREMIPAPKPAVWESRLSCDHCGEDQTELRIYPTQTWGPMHGFQGGDIMCAPCFAGRDGENDFKDFALAQGAAQ